MTQEPLSEEEERKIIVDRYSKGREKLIGQIDEWEDPKYELYHLTDRYGFIHKDPLSDKLTQFESKIRQLEVRRSNKWIKMLENWKDFFDSKGHPKEKLHDRIFKGIPDQVRGKAWCLLMGVPRVKKEQEGRYQEMLEWGLLHSRDVRQIDLDVNRTFRNNLMFQHRYDIKQQELFRILVAYSVYNSEIGYCQGMSQIAALLLMYLHDEEDVFWGLDRLMTDDRYAMHGFFIPGFPKLTRFAKHHDLVLKKYLPKVFKHFKKFDIDSTLYTLKWFFQCFLDRVPFSLTLRLWDVFMLEGEVVLTCMSYTLLKLHKRTVTHKGMEELIEFLQVDLEKDFGFFDDAAIEALQQSMTELKRHKMHLPKDPPPDSEKPTKPFGFLLQADNISMSTDAHSVAGSIVLRPDGISLRSRLSSSLSDIVEDASNEIEVRQDATELFEQLRFIDSFGSNNRTPKQQDQQLQNGKQVDSKEDAQTSQGNQNNDKATQEVSESKKVSDDRHVFFDEQSNSKQDDFVEETTLDSNGKAHPMAESPVGSPNVPVSVVVALKSTVSEDQEDLIQDWPVSNRVYYRASDVLSVRAKPDGDRESPLPHVTASETTQVRSKSSSPARSDSKSSNNARQIKSPSRRTSIPKVIPPSKTSLVSPTHSVPSNKKQSFIPRVVKSPSTDRPTEVRSPDRQDVTTISVGLGKTVPQSPEQDKVRIYVPYSRSERSGSEGSRIRPPIRERNVLPAVDT